MDATIAVEEGQVLVATLMSELAYRAAECDFQKLQTIHSELQRALPTPHALQLLRVEESKGQRYLVGATPEALYVSFQGTKALKDWFANLNIGAARFADHQQPSTAPAPEPEETEELQQLLHELPAYQDVSTSGAPSSSSVPPPAAAADTQPARAHRGFWRRALAIPIQSLHEEASGSGRRLVLCGHSLGGAVATLCTLRLLSLLGLHRSRSTQQPAASAPACIAFAAPPVANKALVRAVQERGWHRHLVNLVLPEDPVVKLAHRLLQGSSDDEHEASSRGLTLQLEQGETSSSYSSSGCPSPASSTTSSMLGGNSTPVGSPLKLKKSNSKLFSKLNRSLQDMQAAVRGLLTGEESPELVTPGDEPTDWQFLLPSVDTPTSASSCKSWLLAVGQAEADGHRCSQWGSEGGSSSSRSLTPSSSWSGDIGEGSVPASPSSSSLGPMDATSIPLHHGGGLVPALWQMMAPAADGDGEEQGPRDQETDKLSAWGELLSLKHLAAAAAEQAAAFSESQQAASEQPASVSAQLSTALLSAANSSWLMSAAAAAPPTSRPLADHAAEAAASRGCPLGHYTQQGLVLTTVAAVARPATAAMLQGPAAAGLLKVAASNPLIATAAQNAARLQRLPATRQLLRRCLSLRAMASLSGTAALSCMRAAAAMLAPPLLPLVSAAAVATAAAAAWPVAGLLLQLAGKAAAARMVPRHYPLGHQWVVTAEGVMPVTAQQLLSSFSADLSGLDVSGLGGLFPAHRMIAYRRRVAQVLQLQPPQQQ